MSTWRINRCSEVIALPSADVVHLDAKQMPQAVWIECHRDACFD